MENAFTNHKKYSLKDLFHTTFSIPLLKISFFTLLIIAVPFTVYLSQQPQTIRQHASQTATDDFSYYSYNDITFSLPASVSKELRNNATRNPHTLSVTLPDITPQGGAAWPPITKSNDLNPLIEQEKTYINTQKVLGATNGLVDLSTYNPSVQDQYAGTLAQNYSCVAWATMYYLRGWYGRHYEQYPAGGFSPMYGYSQKRNSDGNNGMDDSDALTMLQTQGVAPANTYSSLSDAYYNYLSQPTNEQKSKASSYKIPGWSLLYSYQPDREYGTTPTPPNAYNTTSGEQLKHAIETTINNGEPLVLSAVIYNNFFNRNIPYFDSGEGGKGWGHMMFVYAFDEGGVWVENSFGTNWGLHGNAKLSWKFVENYTFFAGKINYIYPTASFTNTAPVQGTVGKQLHITNATSTDTSAHLQRFYMLVEKNDQSDAASWGCGKSSNSGSVFVSRKWCVINGTWQDLAPHTSTSQLDGYWTPPSSGTYYVALVSYSSTNAQCSGDPVYKGKYPLFGYSYCGDTSSITLTIAPTPSQETYGLSGYILTADQNYDCTTTSATGRYTGPTTFTIHYVGKTTGATGNAIVSKDAQQNLGFLANNLPPDMYTITIDVPPGYTLGNCSSHTYDVDVTHAFNPSVGFWVKQITHPTAEFLSPDPRQITQLTKGTLLHISSAIQTPQLQRSFLLVEKSDGSPTTTWDCGKNGSLSGTPFSVSKWCQIAITSKRQTNTQTIIEGYWTSQQPGTYYIAVVASDSLLNQCSGDPLYLSADKNPQHLIYNPTVFGYYYCGEKSYIQVIVK